MLEPFSKAAWLLEQDRRTHSNKHVISKINHLIDRCIRTSSNLVIPDVSVAANQLSTILGIDIYAAKENQKSTIQKYAIAAGENDYFFYEHKITVSEMRIQIMVSNSYEEVIEIFKNQQIVWVLNSENNRLMANGNNIIRPDSDQAYSNAGISIIKNQYKDFEIWKKKSWKNL